MLSSANDLALRLLVLRAVIGDLFLPEAVSSSKILRKVSKSTSSSSLLVSTRRENKSFLRYKPLECCNRPATKLLSLRNADEASETALNL